MNWLTLLGLLCLPGSVASFIAYLRSQRLVHQLATTRLLKVAELHNLRQANPAPKGSDLVQVYGKVACGSPLTAEFSQQPCVYYKSEVSWEYEEIEYHRKYLDSDGNVTYTERIGEDEYQQALISRPKGKPYPLPGTGMGKGSSPGSFQKKPGFEYPGGGSFPGKSSFGHSGFDASGAKSQQFGSPSYPGYPDKPGLAGKDVPPKRAYHGSPANREYVLDRDISTGSEVVHSVVRQVPFFIEDETGRVRVDPTGAEIEPMLVVEERVFPGKGPSKFGFDLSRHFSRMGSKSRTPRCFIYKEWVIPVEAMAFAMGQVRFEGRDPEIRKPFAGGRFMIALRSAEALLEEHRSDANTYLFGAIVLLGIGVFTLLHLLASQQTGGNG